MPSLQVIEETIARMDDYELAERWRNGMFSDEAKPIAEREFQKRGISSVDSVLGEFEPMEARPYKPIVFPVLFAAIGGGNALAQLGGEIAGAMGAALVAVLGTAVGWKLGEVVAVYAKKKDSQAVRTVIYCMALVVWFCLNAFITSALHQPS